MRCDSPISLPRINGKGAKDRVTVACRRCYPCLSNIRNDWTFRLEQELKLAYSGYFITLTYDDVQLPIKKEDHPIARLAHLVNTYGNRVFSEVGVPSLYKKDVQDFIKRMRAKQDYLINSNLLKNTYYNRYSIRYYAVGEYGEKTKRPHYHMIVFNIHPEIAEDIEKIWGMGHVVVKSAGTESIHYTTKYCIKRVGQFDKTKVPPFNLMSKKPPLGIGYYYSAGRYHKDTLSTQAVNIHGKKVNMPAFYKSRIFSDYEQSIFKEQAEEKQVEAYWKSVAFPSADKIAKEIRYEKLQKLKSKNEKL